MSNPGIFVLFSENTSFPNLKSIQIEDNIGEAVHVHINDYRLDLTLNEFENLCNIFSKALMKLDGADDRVQNSPQFLAEIYKLNDYQKIDYEIEKIKSLNQGLKIDHVALRDVSAGYDIKSYEIDGVNYKEIFIEVKAVPVSNYKFHLSMQENQTANKYLDRYYLYLLPVDHSNPEKFDYDKLLRINNVNKSILQNKKDWIIEEDGFVISKKI